MTGDERLIGGGEPEDVGSGRQARRYGLPAEPGEVIPRRLGDLGIRCYTSINNEWIDACFIPTILYPGDEEYDRYAQRLPVIAIGTALPDGSPGRHRAARRRWRWREG